MITVQDWLALNLDKNIEEMAIVNTKRYEASTNKTILKKLILDHPNINPLPFCFVWSESVEGEKFWKKIYLASRN